MSLKVYFGNNLIDEEYYTELTNSYELFNDSFKLGTKPSNKYKLSIAKEGVTNQPSNVILKENNTTFAELEIDNIEEQDYTYSYDLTDKMLNLEFYYDASLIFVNGKTTLLAIAQDICSKAGLTLGTTNFRGYNKEISWYDNRRTAREYIGFIAELNGGFARVENSTLYFRKQKTSSKKTIDIDDCENFIIGEYHKITRVVYELGALKYEFGNETGNTLYLNSDNVFITEESEVQAIYNDIKDFEFYSFETGNCPIDYSVKAGDIITFTDGTNNYPTIAQYELEYFGTWIGGYSLNINTERQEETKVVGNTEKIKNLQIIADRDANAIMQLVETTEEIEHQFETLQDIDGFAEGKYIYLDDASDELITSAKFNGETSQEGTPSPDNPSEIENLEGTLEVKVVNKNLLGLSNIAETLALGLQYSVNNGEIILNGTATSGGRISIPLITPIQCVNGTNYTLSKEATGTASNHGFNVQLRNAGSNIKNYTEAQLPQSFDNVSSFINELGLYIGNGYSFTNYKLKLQLEQGVATEYEEHQEQTVYFPLAEGQKLYEGSYLADDGIHNVRGQVLYDGSSDENWGKMNYAPEGAVQFYVSKPTDIFTETGVVALSKLLSTHFINQDTVNGMRIGNLINFFPSIDLNLTTVEQFKTWLSNNSVILEYPLAEEEIIPYNTEQQAAWNSIKSLHTYKTVTHIYSDAYAEIGYIKDNMLSAFETKASAQLTKNDVSQLKIENGRISSEVSSTQSQLNNYYTKKEADNNTNSTKAELQNIIQQNKTEIEQTTQAINLRVSSIETNGVDKIETSMGYTFDNDGLNIDKEGAATASTIDNEAFKVKNKSANENVFFAGYVSDQDSAYRGQTIVESTNLVVKNYLNIEGASRFQPYVNPVLGGHGTGAFDIG